MGFWKKIVKIFTGGGGGGATSQVAEYHLSMHLGLCLGPVDSIRSIEFEQETVWWGRQSTNGDIVIDRPDLFGGNTKEGGVRGTVEVYLGGPDQVISEEMATRFSSTSALSPGYRGVASLFFRKSSPAIPHTLAQLQALFGTAHRGFYIGANNPYTKPIAVHVERFPKALSEFVYTLPPFSPLRFTKIKGTPPNNFGATLQQDHVKVHAASMLATSSAPLNASYLPSNLYDSNTGTFFATVNNSTPKWLLLDMMRISVSNRPPTRQVRKVAITSRTNNLAYSTGATIKLLDKDGATVFTAPAVSGPTTFSFDVNPPVNARYVRIDQARGYMELTSIEVFGEENPEDWYNCNPADIIFEVLRGPEVNAAVAGIDVDSFLEAQYILYTEKFGISMRWTQQTSAHTMIQEVLDHINAFLFLSVATGKWTLKLIRKEDDAPTRLLHPDNSELISFQRKMWGETVNEVVATWTNPTTEKEETVTVQDLANINFQGGISSTSRNFYGVRDRELAVTLARRDVRAASEPLAVAEVVGNREFWDILPGERVNMTSPEDNIALLTMRVMNVDYGKIGSSQIRLSLTEDVFSKRQHAFILPQSSDFQEIDDKPLQAAAYGYNMPYGLLEQMRGRSFADAQFTLGANRAMWLSEAPNNTHTYFNIHTEKEYLSSEAGYTPGAFMSFSDRAVITTPLSSDEEFSIVTLDEAELRTRTVGTYLLIRNPSAPGGSFTSLDPYAEIALITAVDGTDYTIRRALFDTVPVKAAAGVQVWLFRNDATIIEPETRAGAYGGNGLEFSYKVQTITINSRTLELPYVPSQTGVLKSRITRPLRPRNVRLGGSLSAGVHTGGVTDGQVSYADNSGLMAISWSRSNRRSTDRTWFDPQDDYELGVTTRLEFHPGYSDGVETFYRRSPVYSLSVHGITDTSYNYPLVNLGTEYSRWYKVVVKSEVSTDELEGGSLQGKEFFIYLAAGTPYTSPPL